MAELVQTSTLTEDYVPWHTELDTIEGEPEAMVHWIRRMDEANHGAGLLTMAPSTIRFNTHFHETLCLIEGEVEVEFEDGDKLHLRPGDVTFLRQHTPVSAWRCLSPIKLLFIDTR